MFGFFFFGIVVVVILFFVGLGFLFDNMRKKAWEEVAKKMGFTFTHKGEIDLSSYPFKLFNKGHSRKTRNILQGESNGVVITLLDYRYTTTSGSGKNRSSTTHKQTVCFLEKDGLNLPHMFIRRERFLVDWLGEKFGGQDIDFDEDPAFSKAYVLQGDEIFARKAFSAPLRRYFVDHKKEFATVDTWQNEIMVNYGRKIKPAECQKLMALAFGIVSNLGATSQVEAPETVQGNPSSTLIKNSGVKIRI